jgi:hypothetical protein
MESVLVDINFVTPYFNGKRCENYDKSKDIKEHMCFHVEGYFIDTTTKNDIENVYFQRLIDERRPSESDIIKTYRRISYLPQSKKLCEKAINNLSKIVKSQDWTIDYSKSVVPKKMPDDETLQKYCEENYPEFQSLENWLVSYGMTEMIKDPNAVVIIMPENEYKDKSEFYKPIAEIISCENVIDFVKNKFVVYFDDINNKNKLTIITDYGVYDAVRDKENIYITERLNHKLGFLPAFKTGGIILKLKKLFTLYDSFFSGMLPDLDSLVQTASDLTAEKVQHVFSTMWYYSGQECTKCNGNGKVVKAGKQVVCPACDGQGVLRKSPYKDMMIKQPDGLTGDKQMPTPPAGYIIKPTEMVDKLMKMIEIDGYNALSSIGMEYLAQTPLSQSGVAKAMDGENANAFVYKVAYHMVENILKPFYYCVNEWRYKDYIPDPIERKAMLPQIPIPERFDLLTENIVGAQYTQAVAGKLSDEVIGNLELDYVLKRFNNHPEILQRVQIKKVLDPFSGKNNIDKSDLFATGQVPEKDSIISIYIDNFITRAVIETPDFMTLEYAKQKAIIDKYADEKIKELQPSEKALKTIKDLETGQDDFNEKEDTDTE